MDFSMFGLVIIVLTLRNGILTTAVDTCLKTNVFDFIIVGCGATGSVIANRLSEVSGFQVLVLERGGEPDVDKMDIPDGYWWIPSDMGKLKFTVPQRHMKGIFHVLGAPFFYGSTLGGGSSINDLMFIRGNRRVFDEWKKLGNDGWGSEEILDYFKKTEDYRIPYTYADAKYHGKGGPVTVTRPYIKTSMADAFLEAGNELGYTISDIDGEYQGGAFDYTPSAIKGRKRWSAYRGYIEPARKRKNLNIQTHAPVTKIIIENNQAKGVEYLLRGRNCSAFAKKEVILSAGALHSPQLLMLSGIGPKEHLQKFKIPIKKDLSVGRKLKDQIVYFMGLIQVKDLVPVSYAELGVGLFKKRGRKIITTSSKAVGYVNSSLVKHDGWPDLEVFLEYDGLFQRIASIIFSIKDQLLLRNGTSLVQIVPVLLQPKSEGTLTLKNTDPLGDPLVDPNYLSHPDDVTRLKDGLKYYLKIAESNAMKPFNVKALENGILPGCKHLKTGTDELLDCMVRNFGFSTFHFSGTCKMGNSTDKMAVVDNQLRVYGIRGLRVADASIMPTPTGGHPTATCLMIGEKISDIIKQTWM